jgi:membrane protease YdiL (CAAX protease family)
VDAKKSPNEEKKMMTTAMNALGRDPDRVEAPQDRLGTILLMFAWPAVLYTLLIYVIGRRFIPEGGTTPTWFLLLVLFLGTGAELVAGLVLLHREGYRISFGALRDRIRLRWPMGWKAWIMAVIVFILGLSLSMAMGPVNRVLASVPGFMPPAWWPAASNPTIQVSGAADVFPDINLTGNYLFVLLYSVIGLVNVFGEEIYYRGYLLPRMRGVFGKWDWVTNGVFFTVKHIYQRWLFPGILVGGLSFAFAAGPLGSLPLAMVYHWVGNFLFQMIFLIMAALGVG